MKYKSSRNSRRRGAGSKASTAENDDSRYDAYEDDERQGVYNLRDEPEDADNNTEQLMTYGDCNPYDTYTRYLQRSSSNKDDSQQSVDKDVGYSKAYEDYIRYLQSRISHEEADGEGSESYESYAWYLQHKYDMFIRGSGSTFSTAEKPVPTSIVVPLEDRDDANEHDDNNGELSSLPTRLERFHEYIGARPSRKRSARRRVDSHSSSSMKSSSRSTRSKGGRTKVSTAVVRLNCMSVKSRETDDGTTIAPLALINSCMSGTGTRKDRERHEHVTIRMAPGHERHEHVTIRMASGHAQPYPRNESIDRRSPMSMSMNRKNEALHPGADTNFLSYVDEYLDRNGLESQGYAEEELTFSV